MTAALRFWLIERAFQKTWVTNVYAISGIWGLRMARGQASR